MSQNQKLMNVGYHVRLSAYRACKPGAENDVMAMTLGYFGREWVLQS